MANKDKTVDNLKDLVEVMVLSAIGGVPGDVIAGVINVKERI